MFVRKEIPLFDFVSSTQDTPPYILSILNVTNYKYLDSKVKSRSIDRLFTIKSKAFIKNYVAIKKRGIYEKNYLCSR